MAIIQKRALVGSINPDGIFVHETFDPNTDVFVGPDGTPVSAGGTNINNIENIYATEADRLAGVYTAGDVGKIYIQASDNTLWLLTNHDPQTWLLLGGADQVFNYVFVDDSDRSSHTYTTADVGKIARQTIDNTLWVLVEVDGEGNGTWVQILTSSIIGQPNGVAGLDGSGKVPETQIPSLDATKVTTGIFDIGRIPAAALERLVQVTNQAARFALTTTTVQLGDTVKQLDTGSMYIVIDVANLSNAAGYAEYTAATAAAVPWSGVTDKPNTFPPDEHNHTLVTAATTAHGIRIGAPDTPANGEVWIELA